MARKYLARFKRDTWVGRILAARFVTPLSERRRKEISSLSRRKGRDELGQFVIEGRRGIDAALQSGASILDCVVDAERTSEPEIADLLSRMSCTVWTAATHVLERVADVESPQGILAVVPVRESKADGFDPDRPVLVLDGIQDPGNVGTILRSAAWLGFGSVLAGVGTADWFGPKVVRASMGALFDLDLARCDDLADQVGRWRDAGREIWVADLRGVDLDSWAPSANAVLVLGSEAHGVSTDVAARASGRVTIPPRRGSGRVTESLNVSAAAAILLNAWPPVRP